MVILTIGYFGKVVEASVLGCVDVSESRRLLRSFAKKLASYNVPCVFNVCFRLSFFLPYKFYNF